MSGNNGTIFRGTPVFSSAGKFGTALSGGVMQTPAATTAFLSSGGNVNGTGTIEGWVKSAAQSSIKVAFGHSNVFWVGNDATGLATANIGGTTNFQLTSAVQICDGLYHHVALVFTAGATALFVDGNRVATSATIGSNNTTSTFMLGGFSPAGFDWAGSVDEVRVSTTARYSTATYTVPVAVFANTDASSNALYHLDTDANDTANATPLAANDANILYSPGNWDVTAVRAKTILSGAYFKVLMNVAPTSLSFDMTSLVTPFPQFWYRIDNAEWRLGTVAASVTLTQPSVVNTWNLHTLEVVVKSMPQVTRWTSQTTAVVLTGILGVSTITTSAITAKPLQVMVFSDSIGEGVRVLNNNAASAVDQDDALGAYSMYLREGLGAEISNIGYGSTGYSQASAATGVPAVGTHYNILWSGGPARSFVNLDFIVIHQGTNDAATDTTTAVTALLNGILGQGTLPATCRVVVLRPFGGTAQATFLQNGIAACSNPGRVTYVDTTGFFNTANSSDAVHPYGFECLDSIGPKVANAVKASGKQVFINAAGVSKAVSIVVKT